MSRKNFMSYGDAETILTEYAQGVKDVKNPQFTEAGTRSNIASGESYTTIFGKIKKFFSDLKAVAFSGSYNDLSDKIVFDNEPTQNSNNAVKSGGIFNSMAVFKYDSVNKRGYFEGGAAFSGNIDSSPTAGSNNVVASGGTKTYVDNAIITALDNCKLAIITQTFNNISITRAWGTLYESVQLGFDISSLGLTSAPKAVYFSIVSSTYAVFFEMMAPTATRIPFYLVRPNDSGSSVNTTISALIIY